MKRLAALVALSLVAPAAPVFAQPRMPKVVDERLKIELVAANPDIVTPIAIDIDERGRLFVIESNTHFPPKDYKLFPTDRVRLFEDTDGDGKPDRITDFHTGETHLMSIRLDPQAKVTTLYAATRKEVFILRDTDGDGKADDRKSIVKLETKGNYPHNGLCAVTFDFAGNVYFGFGENLGEPYKLIGADGTTLEGGGEGGNIYSCEKDGNKLRRVATGFWNPFDITVDAFGRVFTVDNDPDSRPPCRLLHVVEGGDYGYRFKYGRKGLHPFTSWNGEIPGTLPMIAGTGEAPSGMLAYESDNLPEDYLGSLLVTSWGDHRIERYVLKPHGASFTSKMEPIVQGDQEFRPVGIAMAPDGSVYFTDWVDKSYPVHGRGRIWRLSAKEEKGVERPDAVKAAEKAITSLHRPTRERAARQLSSSDSGIEELRRIAADAKGSLRARVAAAVQVLHLGKENDQLAGTILQGDAPRELKAIAMRMTRTIPNGVFQNMSNGHDRGVVMLARLESSHLFEDRENALHLFGDADLFIRHAARVSYLNSPGFDTKSLMGAARAEDLQNTYLAMIASPQLVAQSVALMQMASGNADYQEFAGDYLKSSDHNLRLIAIQWIAEAKLEQYRQNLLDSLNRPDTTPRLFAATLAALDLLDGGKPQSADHVGGRFYLERMVFGDKTAPAARAMALRMLPADNPAMKLEPLKKLLNVEDARFKLEVVRTLRFSPHEGAQAVLLEIAKDAKQDAALRAEAVIGLDAGNKEASQFLLDLATGSDVLLQLEALRGMRGADLNDVERQFLSRAARTHEELAEAIGLAMGNGVGERPSAEDTAAWVKLLDSAKPQAATDNADAKARVAAGERVFFSAKAAGCYRCHTVAGRGGVTGPDLSTIGGALSRERLIESILQPSKEIAPRFSSHLIETDAGDRLTLMYVGPSPDGRQIYADSNGKEILLSHAAVLSKKPLQSSIMPADLHKAMTIREMAELVAFLESLK